MSEHRSIIRRGNHFIAGDDGNWILIDGPLFRLFEQSKERNIRQLIFDELVATTNPTTAECVPIQFEYQEWHRCRWHPGCELTKERLRGWVKKKQLRPITSAYLGPEIGRRPELDECDVDWIWRTMYQERLLRPRIKTGYRLLPDGKLPTNQGFWE